MNKTILPKIFGVGCHDGGCVFGHPGGMHTNGGCRCLSEKYHQDYEKQRTIREGLNLLHGLMEVPSIQAALQELLEAMNEKRKQDAMVRHE